MESTADINNKINIFYSPDFKLDEGFQFVKEIEQKNESIKETVKTMIDSIRMEYSVSMEGYIYNYARVNFNPLSNSHSANLIDMAPHSGESNQEHKKKPVKP